MPNGSLNAIVDYLRHISRRDPAAELSDGQLLERFLAARDENAFSTLVQRHGPLVLTVCRRVLHNSHDVEDAFQATFLVLVRKAGSIAKRESVASWLHGVAHRTALRAKTGSGRRADVEKQVIPPPPPDCMQEVILRDLRLILDEEVQRLPERYRLPFVLCYMEGKTNEEAALVLGCPKGTVLSRLSRAREKLRRRLTRRGLGLSAGLVATMLSQSAVSAAVPAGLADLTVKAALAFAGGTAAAGVISANVIALSRGVLQAMFFSKVKIAATVIVMLGLISGGSSLIGLRVFAAKQLSAQREEKSQTAAKPSPARPQNNQVRQETKLDNRPEQDVTLAIGTRAHTFRLAKEARLAEGIRPGVMVDVMAEISEPSKTAVPAAFHALENVKLLAIDKDDVGNRTLTVQVTPTQEKVLVLLEEDAANLHVKLHDDKTPPRPRNIQARAETPFENAFGFGWLSQPTEINLDAKSTSMTTVGGVAWIPEKKDGAVVVTLAHVSGAALGNRQYRPVIFAADRTTRYLPYASMSGGSDAGGASLMMGRYTLDAKTLPPEKVKYIGIEFSTPEGRKAIAKLAIATAKAQAIPILPYPELGEAFTFELPTMDGKKIRSGDLRGKVVLVECWTVGCVPLMEKMPGLKKLYEKRKKDGLEIIGINFDISPESVTDAGELLGLTWPKVAKESPWPQVHVPEDEKIQELWQNAEHLGRLYLIDRQGVLRADCSADDVFASINRLLDSQKKSKD